MSSYANRRGYSVLKNEAFRAKAKTSRKRQRLDDSSAEGVQRVMIEGVLIVLRDDIDASGDVRLPAKKVASEVVGQRRVVVNGVSQMVPVRRPIAESQDCIVVE